VRLFPLFFILTVFISCSRKDEKITADQNAKLTFSTNTVFFDTLFTSVGSITQRVWVFNRNANAVNISSIELGGKATSAYTIIINGKESYYENNITLRGRDSIYILVKLFIDPQNQSLPYLVTDSITFVTNGNSQKIDLIAYGQDATFLNSVTVPCDTTWTNIKPFVIYDFINIAQGCTLTIQKGVRILFHDNAHLHVRGTLLVQGDKDSLVVFSGDKLTFGYENLPGQWQGILFEGSSKNNSFNYAVIKNALTGLKILNDPADTDTIAEVTLSNSIIKNMQGAGLEGYGTDVYAWNSLFANCVKQTVAGFGGGNYHFKHCTFANYSYTFFREEPAVELSNYKNPLAGPLKARLTNCIVWGDRQNELQLSDNTMNTFDFIAANCILKTTRTDQNTNANKININPEFVNPVSLDFHLKSASPAINAGQDLGIIEDLDGKIRDVSPDVGAYEF
jgi:hypothetical protein